MKKILLSVFYCFLTYHFFSSPVSGKITSGPEGVEMFDSQQGFSDLPCQNSEKQFFYFTATENVAPLKYLPKAALNNQSRAISDLGLSMLRLNSRLFQPLSLIIFSYYSLAMVFMALLLIAMGVLWLMQFKARRDAEAGESFFRALIDESPLAMVIFQDLKIEYVNPAMERISGYSQRELEKMEIWQLIHPESLKGVQAENWFLMKKNNGLRFEFRLNTKTGREVWVDFSTRLIDFFGKPAFLATASEITREAGKNTEPALTQTEKAEPIYKSFFDQNQAVMMVYEKANGEIISANAAALKFYGYAEDELIGKPISFIQEGETYPGNNDMHLYGLHRLKSGLVKDVEVFNTLIEEQGRLLVHSLVFDITERKKAEQELKRARDLAEEAAKAKSSFISGISHEIRTPLNSIIGLADLLMQEETLNESIAENLRSIKFSSDHLLSIINDVLDFSKLEAGKVDIDKSDFNLEQLLTDTVKAIEFNALQKGVPVRIRINPNVPQAIVADQARLRQILLNLLGNAVKFTSEGHIDVYVKLLERSGQNCRLKFSVSDTGIGIPENKIQTIFESFTQADEKTFRKFGGTGLGLSISKKLVELQGGAIGVKSIEGIGSTFWFELPVEISEKKVESVSAATPTGLKDLRGMRILLVEDDPMNQFVMTQIFRKWNAQVEVAENGRVAVEKLSKEIFDLVMLDVHMPEMDGFEAAAIIRDRNSAVIDHQVPIIALTADVNAETRSRVREAGMNDFITKPSEPEVLFQKVLENTQMEVETAGKPALEKAHGLAASNHEIKEIKHEAKAALREIFEDNTTATVSLINHFMKQIPQTLEKVNEYLLLEEGEQAAAALHRIKPGFNYLGFAATATKIGELQEVIRKARAPSDIRRHMLIVEQDVKTIMHVLKEILLELESNEPEDT